jgi:hypothetical protein
MIVNILLLISVRFVDEITCLTIKSELYLFLYATELLNKLVVKPVLLFIIIFVYYINFILNYLIQTTHYAFKCIYYKKVYK